MPNERPYKKLGERLKQLREKRFESLPEVSGALEIDVETLAALERGALLPSEEVLLLLVAHFGIKEDEAGKLWQIAGFSPEKIPGSNTMNDNGDIKPNVIVMSDSRIVYTDTVHVMANNFGVVMNFMQNTGDGSQPTAIARVGMSREHAKSVLELLARTLAQSATSRLSGQLPAPKKPKNN